MPREFKPLVRNTNGHADEDYLKKTQESVNFLVHMFSENINCVATILNAQAEQDTGRLIDMLGLVKGRVEDWIEGLKKMEE